MNLQSALAVNVADLTTDEQATEAYRTLFYAADGAMLLEQVDDRLDIAGNDELPEVLVRSSANAENAGNWDAVEVFRVMGKILAKFPNADFSA